MPAQTYVKDRRATGDTLSDLVSRARAGEDDAWAALVEQLTPLLRSVAARIVFRRVDVDEAVQQTWVRCFEHIDRIREATALPAWLVTTCKHESFRILKRHGRSIPLDMDHLVEAAGDSVFTPPRHDPAAALEEGELVALVRRTVAALPEHERRVVRELLLLDGVRGAYTELATRLSMPVGSIGPTRLRAFQRLRREPALQGLVS